MTVRRPTHVIALLHSNEAASALSQQCNGINGTKVDIQIGVLDDIKSDSRRFIGADVLLLDLDPENTGEIDQLDAIINTRLPGTPVVVTAPELSVHDMRRLMRLGVADFVPQPIERNELMTALSHAIEQHRAEATGETPRGKVIAFCKSAGGVGATTLAVQTGCLLAKRYKGRENAACLLDLDLQFGTAGLYLDLEHYNEIPDLAKAPDRLDETLLHSVMARHESGLSVLTSPTDVIPLETLTPEFASALVDVASREYAHVLLDMPGAWTDWTIKVLQSCDLIMLVTHLTVAGVRQAALQLNTLQAQGLGDVPAKVIVNRFEKNWGKSVRIKAAEKALGRAFDFFVQNDYPTVSEAINQGLPLSKYKKRTKVEKSIDSLVEEIADEASVEDLRQEPRLA